MFSPIVSCAVDVHAGHRLVACRTARRSSCACASKRSASALRPPVAHGAGRVDLAALVVEAVADLVADDRADGAVVHRRVRRRIEERRLQDAGGEDDLVLEAAVVGVDGLRRHGPLLAGPPACRDRRAGSPTRTAPSARRCRRDRPRRSSASSSRATCRDSRPSRPSSTASRARPSSSSGAHPVAAAGCARAIAVFRFATSSFIFAFDDAGK